MKGFPSKALTKANDNLNVLLSAVRLTKNWRERTQEVRGDPMPTAYHRMLLMLFIHEMNGGDPIDIDTLAKRVGITYNSTGQVIRRMAFDGLVLVKQDVTGLKRTKRISLTNDGISAATL